MTALDTQEAVRMGERINNGLNRWHLVAEDSGVGDVVTVCGRAIERGAAYTVPRAYVALEKESSRVRRCKRCWR